jgi:hypothetical protein
MRMAVGLAMAAALWAAQPASPVNDVIALVRAQMAEKRPDSQVSKEVHKFKLAERLDDQTIEELESEGAGPKTVEELVWLRDQSRKLPQPATALPFKHGGRPTIEDQRAMLSEARRTALAYAGSLPDFMCTEVVHRYIGEGAGWSLKDTLRLKLTYFEHREDYKLLTINNHATQKSYEDAGGSISEGEFGSILLQVFEPRSAAQFRWDHWTTLRKREVHVLSFRITPEHSTYHLAFGWVGQGGRDSTIVGQHGFVYIDRETNRVLRIWAEADSIPWDFPVQETSTMLDYDFTQISGQQFIVPLRADVRIGSAQMHTRNVLEFQDYQKFGADATISFDGK